MADMVTQASNVEAAMLKLFLSWTRLNKVSAKLYTQTGQSTPHLLQMIQLLEKLSSNHVETFFSIGDDPKGLPIRIEIKPFESPIP